jgi:soluble lytic murein transglycosylase-like protein
MFSAPGERQKRDLAYERLTVILFGNKYVQKCFRLVGAVLVAVGVVSAAMTTGQMQKPTSVVRVDKRTGRLVRQIVVPTSATRRAAPKPELKQVVDETAKRYEVDPLLVHSVIQVESNYNPFALSPKGAQGLMQLIPSTARRFGVTNPWDVQQNIEGGVRYLKYLSGLFPNDLKLTIAAYNAGEGAVWKYGNSVPPYPETLSYVRKVGSYYGGARKSAPATAPSEAKPAPSAKPENLAQESYPPIEHFVDADGRLHIRTRTP